MSELTDNDLIEKALKGEQKAFEMFYDRYADRVFGFLCRFLGNPTIAQEATQNTFISVFNNLHRYRPGKSAAAWVFRIAKNSALKCYRSEKKSRLTLSLDRPAAGEEENESSTLSDFIEASGKGPEEYLQSKQIQEEMQKAVNTLPEKYRVILILHDFEELSYEEVCKAVGIPYNTALTRLARARIMLKKKINPQKLGLIFFIWLISEPSFEGEENEYQFF